MKPEPKNYFPEAKHAEWRAAGMTESYIAVEESGAAIEAGDEDSAWGWLARAVVPAHTLAFLKKERGAQFIRDWGFETKPAEDVYGVDWLDRD